MKFHLVRDLLMRGSVTVLGFFLGATILLAEMTKVPYDPPTFERTAYFFKEAEGQVSHLVQLRGALASTEARVLLSFGDQVFVISHLKDLEERTDALVEADPLAEITSEEADLLCQDVTEEVCVGLGYWALREREEVADIDGLTGSVSELLDAIAEQKPIADALHEDLGSDVELPVSERESEPVALPESKPQSESFEPLFAGGGIDIELLTSLLGRDWAEKFFETDQLPEATAAKAIGFALNPEFYGEHKNLVAVSRDPGECGPPDPIQFGDLNDIAFPGVSYLDRYFNYNPLSPRHSSLQTWDFMGGDVLALVVVVEGDGDWNNVAVAQRSFPAVRAWEEWADWNNRVGRKVMTANMVVRRHGMSDIFRPARRMDHSGDCDDWMALEYNDRILHDLDDAVDANCGIIDRASDIACILDAFRHSRPAGAADWAHLHVILDGRGNGGFEQTNTYARQCPWMSWSLYTNVGISRYNTKLAFHGIGHGSEAPLIKGARDEFGSHSCNRRGGYYNTFNRNAPPSNGGSCSTPRGRCIYRKNASWLADIDNIPLCQWTRRMVGLWDSNNDCVLDQNDSHPFVMVEERPDLFFLFENPPGPTTRQVFRGIAWDCGTQSIADPTIRITTNEIIRLRYSVKADAVGLPEGTPLGDLDGHIVGESRVVEMSNPGKSYAFFTLRFEFPNGVDVPTLSSDALEISAVNDVLNGSNLTAVGCNGINSISIPSTSGGNPVYVDFSLATPIHFPAGLVDTLPFVIGYERTDGQWFAVQDVEAALGKLQSAVGHDDFGALLIQSPKDLEKLGFLAEQDFSMWQLVEEEPPN